MKKLTVLLLVYLFAVSPVSAKINIFACEPEWAALAEAIAGQYANVFSATTAHQDPHFIQARPSLIARARTADLLFCTGADLEIGWLPLLLRKSGNADIQPGKPGNLMASEHVHLLDRPTVIDRSGGDIHPFGSPHIHLDPRNISTVAGELLSRLIRIDAERSEDYEKSHAAFLMRWKQAIQEWQDRAGPLRGKPVVVSHNSWSYFNNWLGLEQINVLEPKPGLSPSASHLARLVEQDRAEPAAMLLHAVYEDRRAASWYAEKTAVPLVTLPYTVGGTSAATDLFGLFDDTISRMLEAIR